MQARNSLFRTRIIDIVPRLALVPLQGRRNRRFKRSALSKSAELLRCADCDALDRKRRSKRKQKETVRSERKANSMSNEYTGLGVWFRLALRFTASVPLRLA